MRWLYVPVLGLALALGGAGEAPAFTMGETMGTTAVQGTLAGQSSSGVAATIGGVRQAVNQSVGAYNQRFTAALGGNVPPPPSGGGAGGTRWVAAGGAELHVVSQSWATVEAGLGGVSGWRAAEAFAEGANQAWRGAEASWPMGGLVP